MKKKRVNAASGRTGVSRLVGALMLLLSIGSLGCTAALAQAPAPLLVGPVYTSLDDDRVPRFPRVQVVLSSATKQPSPGDLTILEDGVAGSHATEVNTFESTGYGVTAVVAIDVSGSMAGGPLSIIRDSLYKFVSDKREQDRVGIVTIADDTRWDVPFGSDQNLLKDRLQTMKPRGSKTRLYDGLLTALGSFDPGMPARRELTLISDGHDEGSRSHLEDVVKMAQERHIAIDTLGLTRSSPAYFPVLTSLAAKTGGTFHRARSDAELQSLIANGMSSIKAQPVATFNLDHIRADGQLHRLGVRWEGAAAPSGETDFSAPSSSAKDFFRRLPVWAYGLVALACLALAFVLYLWLGPRKHRNEPVRALEMPQPVVSPALSGGASRPHPATSMEGTPAEPPPNRSVPAAVEPVRSAAHARHNKTQIASMFDASSGIVGRLRVLSEFRNGESYDIPAGEFWIGAAPGNDLSMADDPTASGRHAYLIFQDPILFIVDNQSTNGTRVNGELLLGARSPLRPGDEIQIGRVLFRLEPVV